MKNLNFLVSSPFITLIITTLLCVASTATTITKLPFKLGATNYEPYINLNQRSHRQTREITDEKKLNEQKPIKNEASINDTIEEIPQPEAFLGLFRKPANRPKYIRIIPSRYSRYRIRPKSDHYREGSQRKRNYVSYNPHDSDYSYSGIEPNQLGYYDTMIYRRPKPVRGAVSFQSPIYFKEIKPNHRPDPNFFHQFSSKVSFPSLTSIFSAGSDFISKLNPLRYFPIEKTVPTAPIYVQRLNYNDQRVKSYNSYEPTAYRYERPTYDTRVTNDNYEERPKHNSYFTNDRHVQSFEEPRHTDYMKNFMEYNQKPLQILLSGFPTPTVSKYSTKKGKEKETHLQLAFNLNSKHNRYRREITTESASQLTFNLTENEDSKEETLDALQVEEIPKPEPLRWTNRPPSYPRQRFRIHSIKPKRNRLKPNYNRYPTGDLIQYAYVEDDYFQRELEKNKLQFYENEISRSSYPNKDSYYFESPIYFKEVTPVLENPPGHHQFSSLFSLPSLKNMISLGSNVLKILNPLRYIVGSEPASTKPTYVKRLNRKVQPMRNYIPFTRTPIWNERPTYEYKTEPNYKYYTSNKHAFHNLYSQSNEKDYHNDFSHKDNVRHNLEYSYYEDVDDSMNRKENRYSEYDATKNERGEDTFNQNDETIIHDPTFFDDFPLTDDLYIGKDGNIYVKDENTDPNDIAYSPTDAREAPNERKDSRPFQQERVRMFGRYEETRRKRPRSQLAKKYFSESPAVEDGSARTGFY